MRKLLNNLSRRPDVTDHAARLAGPQRRVLDVALEIAIGRSDRVTRPVDDLAICPPPFADRGTLARSLARSRPSRRVPFRKGLVSQDAMGRIRPPDVEQVRQ